MGKKQRKIHREKRLKNKRAKTEFAKNIEKNVPKSELWFREIYKPYHHFQDQYNIVFASYVPDVINKYYKYIIEIDGSIHELDSVKEKDIKKTKCYNSLGYTVIRIKAFNIESFEIAMQIICRIRGPHYKPAKIYSQKEIEELTYRYETTDRNRE